MDKSSSRQHKQVAEHRLPSPCMRCGVTNPWQAKFCAECGAPLAIPKRASEWRPLTVLFCDLVGSTPLAERKDPEEFRALLLAYQRCCRRVITQWGGTIAQFLGDGVLAYFGYPQAHEHDAQQAVEAGLDLVEAVGTLKRHGEGLKLRIGIHTGPVIIGPGPVAGYLTAQAVGDTPHMAARLQAAARPNTVLLSPTTARQVRDIFELEPLPARRLKGFSQQLPVYRVRARRRAGAGEASPLFGFVPFIGRRRELARGRGQWHRAQAGHRQVLQIVGEPGIGKSRFIDVLQQEAKRTGGTILACRCSSYYQRTALQPFILLLQREFSIRGSDSREIQSAKLIQGLESLGLPVGEAFPLLGRLLNVADCDPFPPLAPQKARHQTLEMLCALVAAQAEHRPTLFILEDLQWADPSTLELTAKLVNIRDHTPLLVVLSQRADFTLPWALPPNAVRLELEQLTEAQSKLLITRIAGKPLPEEIIQHLLAHTDGVPLFLEELTRAVLEAGILHEGKERYERQGPLPPARIPTTLFDALMPRFDRLGEALPVAQIAAVLGREFRYRLLEAVANRPRAALRRALEKLQAAQLLFGTGDSPEAGYAFKHSLIRDAAYHSLLRSQRQRIHGRIARILEKEFPEIAATQPELLAYHYQAAARYGRAITYWHKAGQRALEHSANHEAIGHFKQGLAVLPKLPDTAERQHKELLLQSALGAPLIMTQGYGAPEVESTYARARALCQRGGDPRQRFTALRGLWVFYLVRAEYRTALKLGEQLLRLAAREQDPDLRLEGQMTVGIPLFYCAAITRARTHLREALALYEPQRHRLHAFLYGQDPGIACGGFEAWALLLLGYPDQARKCMVQTVRLAERQAHPFSLAYALHFAALIHQGCREPQLTEEAAKAESALSQTQGFPLFLGGGTAFLGWARVEKGCWSEGIMQMQQGIDLWRSTGAEVARTFWLALLAEAYGTIRQPEHGHAILAEAFSAMDKHQDFFYGAELYRIQGDLLLHSPGAASAAEASFRQALALARQQKTRLLELRAAISLSRLWKEAGKRQEARRLLGRLCGQFTEGFDIVDLKRAKTLLNELK